MAQRKTEEDLLLAAHVGDVEKVEWFIYVAWLIQDGVDVNCADILGHSPLHLAASGGHVGVAELLLEAGANVDSRDKPGNTPLHKAALWGHVSVAELLLETGAQVDSRNEFGNTPLHWAGGHVGVAEVLLNAGAEVERNNNYGSRPLHKAALGGHVGVAKLLLKAGAQIDSIDEYDNTPLHWAASEGHVGVAELLLKAGAQLDSRNREGKTSEDNAAEKGVPPDCSATEKGRILEGRKRILELFSRQTMVGPLIHKVGPEGGELQTASCTVLVPPGAVTMETEITCEVISPNDVTLPLKDGEMLVSDVIQLGPHGTAFHRPVTVQLQYTSTSAGGVREQVVWIMKDKSQWTGIKATKKGKDTLAVSVTHFSMFAVISHPWKDQFLMSSDGGTLTSSTLPDVQIKVPKLSVKKHTTVKLQVQEVPKQTVEEMKAKDPSSSGLVCTSPIVKVEAAGDSPVHFNKPVTVRVPHPQTYMKIESEEPTELRVTSCEEGTDDWVDVTDDVNIQDKGEFVEFDVIQTSSHVILEVKVGGQLKEFGPIPLTLCKWIQQHEVQFILLQRENDRNTFFVECTKASEASDIMAGYKAPASSNPVLLSEGQNVEINLVGNVSFAPFGKSENRITFHSQLKHNRLPIIVRATNVRGQEDLDGVGLVTFHALPRITVGSSELHGNRVRSALRTKQASVERPRPTFLCELPIEVPVTRKIGDTEAAAGTARNVPAVARHFYFIKEEVSSDWGDLAFHLGFKWADIRNIAGRNPDDKSSCMDLLWEWEKREGSGATIEVLMEALSRTGLQNVLDGLKILVVE